MNEGSVNMGMLHLEETQRWLAGQQSDGWLVWDFRGNNPVFSQLLPGRRHLTRRAMLWVPARGQPRLLVSRIDAPQFRDVGLPIDEYFSGEELEAQVRALLRAARRVAMEYVPRGQLPAVSIVDAGTIEWVREMGVAVVSSADLVQVAAATWSEAAIVGHHRASRLVGRIKDDAFARVASAWQGGHAESECGIAEFVRERFAEEGLESADGPIVAVNGHAGDPHFTPDPTRDTPIRRGDWLLLDLWARVPGEEHVFSDITWVATCGSSASVEQQRAFDAVRSARDATLKLAEQSWRAGTPVQGWQLDEAARRVLVDAGYAEALRHRTGHSLSPGGNVHGVGMNLDGVETRDTRTMLAGTGFTIEPGVYCRHFGVRLEINVFVDPRRGPIVTSCVQDELVRLD